MLFRSLQQAGDEGARAGEGVDNLHTTVVQRAAEMFVQHVLHAVDDEVHNLDGRIDDAQLLLHPGEGGGEELVVEFHHNLLLGLSVVDTLGTAAHAAVESLKALAVGFVNLLVEQRHYATHGFADGVVGGEGVAVEQCFEDRLGDDMLRQHLHCLRLTDRRVDVLVQPLQEAEIFSLLHF